VSIVEFKRAKLLQDAKLSGVTVADIARALATMAGVKAVSDFDAGLTSSYIAKAEALLDVAAMMSASNVLLGTLASHQLRHLCHVGRPPDRHH
jgi:hypothetical protein